jgi:hypothetical protein
LVIKALDSGYGLDSDSIRIGMQSKMLDPDPFQMNTVRIRNAARIFHLEFEISSSFSCLCWNGSGDLPEGENHGFSSFSSKLSSLLKKVVFVNNQEIVECDFKKN